MTRMILPERTVDAWVATYITGRQWRARIWAPTERIRFERYDLAVGLRSVGRSGPDVGPDWPDKVFVLEHKGVGADLKVNIPIKQLCEHFEGDRAAGGKLVYYVLPALAPREEQPHSVWSTTPHAPYGAVPGSASHRLRGALPSGTGKWPSFAQTAVVVHVTDLASDLGLVDETGKCAPKQGPPVKLGINRLWHLPNARPLRDFVSAVRGCHCGREAGEPDLQAFIGKHGEERRTETRSAGPASHLSFYGVGAAA